MDACRQCALEEASRFLLIWLGFLTEDPWSGLGMKDVKALQLCGEKAVSLLSRLSSQLDKEA
jgi:hypothetical protein